MKSRLGVLPLELNKLLIIVVVLSMALTPLLYEVGRWAAVFIDDKFGTEDVCSYTMVLGSFCRMTGGGLNMWTRISDHCDVIC